MLLRLFEKRTKSFADIGETQLIRLGEALPIACQLLLFELEISFQRVTRVLRRWNLPNSRGRYSSEKRHLGREHPSVVEFLGEMLRQLPDGAHVFRTGNRRDV